MDMEIIYEALRAFDEKRTRIGNLAVGSLSPPMSAVFLDIESRVDQSNADERRSQSLVRTGVALSPNVIVERPPLPECLRHIAKNSLNHDAQRRAVWEASHELTRLKAENARLEDQHEQIMLAICGGEDAPGHAASLGAEEAISVMNDVMKLRFLAEDSAKEFMAENERLRETSLLLANRVHRLAYDVWGMPGTRAAEHICKECGGNTKRLYEGPGIPGHPKDGVHEDGCLVGLAGKMLADAALTQPTSKEGQTDE